MQWEVGGAKFPQRRSRLAGLWSPPMTKQFAIAAGNHGAGIPEKTHDGVPRRCRLPFITGKLSGAEDHPGNLLLGRAGARAVRSLDHPPGPRHLLAGQTRVGWNSAAVERCEKTGNRLHAVEAIEAERDQRRELLIAGDTGRPDDMNALAIAEVMQVMGAVPRGQSIRPRQRFWNIAIGREDGRGRAQDDRTGIGLWKPEDVRLGGVQRWVCWDIATSIAGWRAPSAARRGSSFRRIQHSRADSPRCVAAIPIRSQAPSDGRYSRSSMTIATGRRPATFATSSIEF